MKHSCPNSKIQKTKQNKKLGKSVAKAELQVNGKNERSKKLRKAFFHTTLLIYRTSRQCIIKAGNVNL